MISVLLAIIIDALTFYVAMIYGSNSFALLGFAEAVFFVYTFSTMIPKNIKSRYVLEVPVTMVEQGQKLMVRVRVEGTSMRDLSRLNCRVELRGGAGRKNQHSIKLQSIRKNRHSTKFQSIRKNRHSTKLQSIKKNQRSVKILHSRRMHRLEKRKFTRQAESENRKCCVYEITCNRPGRYEVTLQSVTLHDITGLIPMRKRTRQRIAIDVLPTFTQVPVRLTEPVLHFVGDADVYDENQAGHDSSETLQYRPFQEGDKIQRIHWKLSARSDELIVKESSLPKACPITLQLVHGGGDYLKAAGSLSFSILDAGCPHYVSWYSEREQDVLRLRVDDEESLYEFLLRYMQDMEPKEKVDIVQAYREKYTADLIIHTLYLDEGLKLYQNGELRTQLDGRRLDQSLNSMEVIL